MLLHSKITASHYILPSGRLTNEMLSERFPPKKVAGVSKLSGIYERRVAASDITAGDMGYECARRLVESKDIDVSSFDLLIFVSSTRDYILPPTASIIHEKLNLPETCGSFDMVLGCPAFPYALSVANGMIASLQCKKILLVIADAVTKLVNPMDRGLVTLHGDGAAAFVLEPSDTSVGVDFIDLGTDSKDWRNLVVPAGGFKLPKSAVTCQPKTDDSGATFTDENIQMNGAAVFHFSMTKIPEQISASLKRRNIGIDDIDLILLHQANKMMLEEIYRQIGIVDDSKKFFFMEKIGNLGAASTPVLLAEALRCGKIIGSMNVLLSSFGVGLSWGTALIHFKSAEKIASSAETEF